jgi:hypothetical protein
MECTTLLSASQKRFSLPKAHDCFMIVFRSLTWGMGVIYIQKKNVDADGAKQNYRHFRPHARHCGL